MSHIAYSRIIAAAPDKVYTVSQYYSDEWDPFSRVPHDAAPKQGTRVGLRTRIVAWHGLSMDVEYIQVQRPERAAMKMITGPRFLAAFAGTWRFLPHGQGKTHARFEYHLRAAKGFRWLAPMMRFYFAWETRRRLNALAQYCEQQLPNTDECFKHLTEKENIKWNSSPFSMTAYVPSALGKNVISSVMTDMGV